MGQASGDSWEGNVISVEAYGLGGPGMPDRAAVYNERQSNHYRISGTNLISVTSTGAVSTLGTIPGAKQASMPYSFNTQCVIASGNMFLYDPTGGFRHVTDPDLGAPIDGVWVDGYYFLTDGEFIYHTDITDESSIDPLKFATAEFSPDPTLAVAKTNDNKVIVFGRYSTEYFVNAATENFAFQRLETRAQKIGIVATHAKCESSGVFYITGGRKFEDLGVHIIGVGTSQKISTREVDKVLNEYTELELGDMRMEARTESGTEFILVHLPNETLCFNNTIAKSMGLDNAWCILKTGTRPGPYLEAAPYRAINSVFDPRVGAWICGDKEDGRLGQYDDSLATQYDEIAEWEMLSPFLLIPYASISELEIETIAGTSAADDAAVAISTTYDGLTYSTEEFNAIYSAPYDYGQRFIARRFGLVRDRIGFRFRGVSRSKMAFANFRVNY